MNRRKFDFNIYKINSAFFLRAFLMLSPVMLFFYQENGLDVQTLFLFQGVFYLVSIISEAPVGYLVDFFSRKKIILLSFFLFLLRTLLWIFCKGYLIILTGEILFALSKTMMDNCMSGYLYDYLNKRRKNNKMAKYYGYLNFYLALATSVAALVGTYIYKTSGTKVVLIGEAILISVAILFITFIPNIKSVKNKCSMTIKEYCVFVKTIYHNESIIYYIFYSGILTSGSILFAVSFQPLMQNSFFPMFLFGVVASCNHIIRALASVLSGLVQKYISIRKLVIPVYVLFIFAFMLIFKISSQNNIKLNFLMIFIICLIIGLQLLFTIMHVSRLHHFVSNEKRGTLMSVNNFVSRFISALILLSSKLFIDRLGLHSYYLIAFTIFVIFLTFVMVKTYKIREKV